MSVCVINSLVPSPSLTSADFHRAHCRCDTVFSCVTTEMKVGTTLHVKEELIIGKSHSTKPTLAVLIN